PVQVLVVRGAVGEEAREAHAVRFDAGEEDVVLDVIEQRCAPPAHPAVEPFGGELREDRPGRPRVEGVSGVVRPEPQRVTRREPAVVRRLLDLFRGRLVVRLQRGRDGDAGFVPGVRKPEAFEAFRRGDVHRAEQPDPNALGRQRAADRRLPAAVGFAEMKEAVLDVRDARVHRRPLNPRDERPAVLAGLGDEHVRGRVQPREIRQGSLAHETLQERRRELVELDEEDAAIHGTMLVPHCPRASRDAGEPRRSGYSKRDVPRRRGACPGRRGGSRMRVCVQGLGYIGLPTAAMMALGGHDVVGYDVDRRVLDALRDGAHHVKEEPVRALVLAALNGGRLTLSTEVPGDADAHVICVPTPTIDHKPDLSYVRAAARATAPHLRPGDLVILESTVPPGTMDRVVVPALREAGVDPDTIAVAHCPERVIPGAIVRELRGNARVVGGRKPGDAERAADLYRSFCDGEIHVTDNVTAELVKVVENTYRDVNIAFANELALLSEELGVDAHEAIALANKHPRVNILAPGPGVGGHCIPVDPHFLSNANPF